MGLWALHLSDGVVTPAWWIAGWFLAGLLVLLGSWRLRDEDIPRVALLAAAFFVVSLIHVPVPGGPRAHLLLAGLLGVVLGRHAALAIPLGLVLQTILFSHGGLTMIGVNSVVMTVPALAAWGLFAGLRRLPGHRTPTFRASLIFTSVTFFLLSAVFAGALLTTNPWTEMEHGPALTPALTWTFAPGVLLLVAALGLLAVLVERRNPAGPEFALGLLVGEVAVLVAVALNGMVLLLGGEGDWHAMVFLTVLVHLPLAVVEGVVLGFTIRFLARVQPDLIGLPAEQPTPSAPPRTSAGIVALLLVVLVPSAAEAHGFSAEYKIDRAARRVKVECWYETGEAPRNATIVVRRADGSEVVTGKFDAEGLFEFPYDSAEDLTVDIDAGAGHRAHLEISAGKLGRDGRGTVPVRETIAGLAFVLALAAFLLSWRNSRRLAAIQRSLDALREPGRGDRV
jgi:cobalt/nickel transport system permease protein